MSTPDSQLSRIYEYFPDLSGQQQQQLRALYPLYRSWNEKINVVSRKDIQHLYLHHVLHSLSIAKFVSFQPGAWVLDIGTGGGFPGILLAIMFPDAAFHLVDSIGKKITVVKEVARELELENIQATHQRAEKTKGTYDFIVTRAVARLGLLQQWSRGKVAAISKHEVYNGLICLKGGDLRGTECCLESGGSRESWGAGSGPWELHQRGAGSLRDRGHRRKSRSLYQILRECT